MKQRKIVLGLIVISLAFAIGFLTFKAAEIFKTVLVGTGSDCTQQYKGRSCPESREERYSSALPTR